MSTSHFERINLAVIGALVLSLSHWGCGIDSALFPPRDTLPSTIDDEIADPDNYEIVAEPDDQPGKWNFELHARRSWTDPSQLRFRWDFGDGETAEGTEQTHTFSQPGVYHIVVRGINSSGGVVFTLRLDLEVPMANHEPTVVVTESQSIFESDNVFLDGSGTTDADGDELIFDWRQVSGPAVLLSNADAPIASFVAPMVTADVRLVFELSVSDGTHTASSIATVDVLDYVDPSGTGLPQCLFSIVLNQGTPSEDAVPPFDGPRPLTTTLTAATVGTAPPEGGTYTWTIEGAAETGSISDNAVISRIFTTAGIHTIALTLTVAGVSVRCQSSQNGDLQGYVTVWPIIEGRVEDPTGNGVGGVTVSAGSGGTTAVTDASGAFRVQVPYDWSGTVTAQHASYTFTPQSSTFAAVELDVLNHRILAEAIPIPPEPPGGCTGDSNCADALYCNGAERCVSGICEAGSNPCATGLTCDEVNDRCVSTTQCTSDTNCSDGQFCNGVERCVSGQCVVGSAPCTTGQTCDEANNLCVTPPQCTTDAFCGDGRFCNGAERCVSGQCVVGSSPCAAAETCDEATDRCVGASTTFYVDRTLSTDCPTTYNVSTRSCGGGSAAAYRTIAGAAAVAGPGQTVVLRGGTHNERLVPQRSGAAGQYLTFRAHTGEAPIITGAFAPAVDLTNRSYIVLDGLTVNNVTGWVRVQDGQFNVIRNCTFTVATAGGTTGGVKFVRAHRNQVLNNIIDDGNDNLLFIDSDRNLIEGNTITRGRHAVWGVKCGDFNVVRNNYFHNANQKIGEVFDCEGVPSDAPFQLNATKHNLIEGNTFAFTPSESEPHRTNGIQYSAQEGIIRHNVFYDNNGGALQFAIYSDEALHNSANRVFHNVFYANDCGGIYLGGETGQDYADNLFKNNILFGNRDCLGSGQTQIIVDGAIGFSLVNNNILYQTAGQLVINWRQSSPFATRSLAWSATNYPQLVGANVEVDPRFVNATGHDFHLASDSSMIDAGVFLTRTVSAGSGTLMSVEDIRYFYDGFGISGEIGDPIQLQGQTTTARVVSIDYLNRRLTLSNSLTWTNGQGVTLAYSGVAPDIGAFESGFAAPPQCTTHANCSDGQFCNGAEVCSSGRCVTGSNPCQTGYTCDEAGDRCVPPAPQCTGNAQCDDGLFCNGAETCVSGNCVAGGNPCTTGQTCNEAANTCDTPTPGAWTPPLGVPTPSFGVNEAHTRYAGLVFATGGFVYRDAGNGPYTHYVDNTHSSATDSTNPYGTATRPRLTIPTTLPAGSVVEIHGGPYTYNIGGRLPMEGLGTAQNPVFIRGVSAAARPIFTSQVELLGNYLIVENIDNAGPDSGVYTLPPAHHIALRHSAVRNGTGGPESAVFAGSWGTSGSSTVTNIVILDCQIHDNGNWLATFDEDHHGVRVGPYANNVWIVDSELYHNSGDGVSLLAGSPSLMPTCHHVYIAGNHCYENKQSGVWIKEAQDVIISQNRIHSMTPTGSSSGQGAGYQYGPERVWFLFNEIYDCDFGIISGSNSGPGGNGPGQNMYIIGNIIHDIHSSGGGETGAWRSGVGISLRDETGTKHLINNTIYNTDAGITNPRQAPLRIVNNILAAVSGEHIFIEQAGPASASTLQNTLFDVTARIKWGSSTQLNITQFRSQFVGKGLGCLEANPLFVAPSTNDFRVQSASPAVNAGVIDSVYASFLSLYGVDIAKDVAGLPRPTGAAYDMGAHER